MQDIQIAAQWRLQSCFGQHAGNIIFIGDKFCSNHRLLPFEKATGGIRNQRRDAIRRQRGRVAHQLPQAFGVAVSAAKEIAPEVSFVALKLRQAVKKISKPGGLVSGASHGVKRNPVGNELLLLLALIRASGIDQRSVIDEAVPLIENVVAVANLGYAERCLKVTREINGNLMGDDVANLMGEQPGQFIFVLYQGNDFAREVDASASQPKRVIPGKVDDGELIVDFGGRQLGQKTLPKLFQVVLLRVVNHAEFFFNARSHNLAQPFFLLLGKDVGFVDHRGEGRHCTWAARRLRVLALHRARTSAHRKHQEKNGEKMKMFTPDHNDSKEGLPHFIFAFCSRAGFLRL